MLRDLGEAHMTLADDKHMTLHTIKLALLVLLLCALTLPAVAAEIDVSSQPVVTVGGNLFSLA
jgi:hypothetical protein